MSSRVEGSRGTHCRARPTTSSRRPESLESDLKHLGKPNTSAGQQAKDSVDRLSSDLKTDTESIESAVDGASDASGVATAVTTISTTLVTARNQVSSTLNSLKELDAEGELQTAFQQSSACQQLSNASPSTT